MGLRVRTSGRGLNASNNPPSNARRRAGALRRAVAAVPVGELLEPRTLFSLPVAASGLLAVADSHGQVHVGWSDNSADETGFKVLRSTDGGQTYTLLATAATNATAYVDGAVTVGSTYAYEVVATNATGDAAATAAGGATVPLTGTAIGTTGSTGNAPGNASDGNVWDFYDSVAATGGWAGLDLGSARAVTAVAYAPRSGYATRMIGGVFQGSNAADFSSGVTTLYTVAAAPPYGQMTNVAVTGGTGGTYRYVRFLASTADYGDVAEVQVFGTVAAVRPLPASGLAAMASSHGQVNLAWADNSTNEAGFKVLRSTDGGATFAQVGTTLAGTASYADAGLTADATYTYKVVATGPGGDAAASAVVTVKVPLTGTVIGTAGSYNNIPGDTAASAFDGDLSTFFDGPDASGDSTGLDLGLDLGTSCAVTAISFAPRSGFASRMTGGVFQGSNTADFSAGVTTLYTVSAAPNPGQLTTVTIPAAGPFRYVRYVGPTSGECDVAEVQFFGTPVVPAAPGNLTATPASASGVNLSWSDVAAESGFAVQRSPNGTTGWAAVGTTAAHVLTFADAGLSAATAYYYRVQATNAAAASAWSTTATATTAAALPATASGLTASAGTPGQVSLAWADNSTNETGFKVLRSTNGGAYATLATTAANATAYADATAAPGTAYVYEVIATNAAGDAAASNTAALTTVPAAPGGVAATAPSAGQVTVSWSDATGATGFVVQRSPDGTTGWAQVGTTAAHILSFANTGLAAGTAYYYRVQATDAGGGSAWSASASATTPAAVPAPATALTATADSHGDLLLAWTDNSANETGFKVLRSTNGGAYAPVTTTAANATAYTDAGRTPGTTYAYQVVATNAAGDAPAATTAAGVVAPLAGTVTGTAGSFNNNGNTTAKAFDGSLATYFDGPAADGDWAGLDLGATYRITALSYASRSGWAARMNGGQFQASSAADFSSGVVTLYTVPANANPGSTSLTTQTVDSATGYRYVRYLAPAGGYGNTAELQFFGTAAAAAVDVPPAATGLTATATSATQVNLSWTDNSNNETGFKVLRSTSGGGYTTIFTTAANATSTATYNDTTAAAGTAYSYEIVATNAAGDAPASNVAMVTIAPGQAPGVSATAVSATEIDLSLSAVVGATGYVVQRSPNGTTGWVQVASPTSSSFSDTGLSPDTTYYYRAAATNAGGPSPWSTTVPATTVVATPTQPAIPSLTVVSPSEIDLTWPAVTNAASYSVQRSPDGSTSWTQVGTPTAASFDSTGLSAITTYYFRVQALNPGGSSAWSSVAHAQTSTTASAPAPASNLVLVNSPLGGISLGWVDHSTSETGFKILRSADGGTTYSVLTTTDANAVGYRDATAAVDQTYSYEVVATNGVADAAATAPLTVTVVPSPTVSPLTFASAVAAPGGADAVSGSAVTITATAAPYHNNGDPLTYHWSLIDPVAPAVPVTETTSAPTLTYPVGTAGTWSVTLTVGDPNAVTPTAVTRQLAVAIPAPLTISGPTLLDAGGTGNYLAAGTATDGTTWTVTKNGATITTGLGTEFAFTPTVGGTYVVRATAIDPSGASSSASTGLTVAQPAPTVTISGPALGFVGKSLTFAANVPAVTGEQVGYQWTLLNGDGSPYANSAISGSGGLSTVVVGGSLPAGTYRVQVAVSGVVDGAASESTIRTFDFSVLADPNAGGFSWGALPTDADTLELKTTAIVPLPDGRIAVAGHLDDAHPEDAGLAIVPPESFIAMFNADLTLDTAFGSDHTGFVPVDCEPLDVTGVSDATDMAFNPTNQDLVVIGQVGLNPALCVSEYTSRSTVTVGGKMLLAGTPDPKFNDGAPLIMPSAMTDSAGLTVSVSPSDGSILVGGVEMTYGTPAAIAIAQSEFSNPNYEFTAGIGVVNFLLVKLTATGHLDTTFNGTGVAQEPDFTGLPAYVPFSTDQAMPQPINWPDTAVVWATGMDEILPQADGKILAGGIIDRTDELDENGPAVGIALTRYNADGTLDTTFGTGGMTFTTSQSINGTPYGYATLGAMETLANGNILVAGLAAQFNSASTPTPHVVLAEYGPNGAPDLSYGVDGVLNEPSLLDMPGLESSIRVFGIPRIDAFFSDNAPMVFQPDGKLVATLHSRDATYDDPSTTWTLARIDPDGSLDTSFGGSGTGKMTVPAPAAPDPEYYGTGGFYPDQRSSAMVVTNDTVIAAGMFEKVEYNGSLHMPLVVRYSLTPDLAVANLSASDPSGGPVTLTWTNAGYGQDGFEVERTTSASPAAADWMLLATVGPDQNDYSDASVGTEPNNTTFYYRVVPFSSDPSSGAEVDGVPSATAPVRVTPAPIADGYKLQEVVEVPVAASGGLPVPAIVTSITELLSSRDYLLVASGDVALQDGYTADGAYWYSSSDSKTYGRTFGGVTYGLAIANDPAGSTPVPVVPDWGVADPNGHTYTLAFAGQNSPLAFQFKAAAYPSGGGPLQLEIWARSPATPPSPTVPVPPSGLSTFQVSAPTANSLSTPPVLSVQGTIDVEASSIDGSAVPWTLSLVAPDGTTQQIGSGSGTVTTVPIDPAAHHDGVYTLELTTAFPSPQQNYTTTTKVALEAPVVRVTSPVVDRGGLPPIVNQNTPIDVIAAAPDGSTIPWALSLVAADGTVTPLAGSAASVGQLPVTAAQVVVLDPALYANGTYTLRLTTTLAGQANVASERTIDIETIAKVGNLSLPVTDDTVATATGTVTVSRTYDTGQVARPDGLPGFGPGWTFDLIDAHLTTTARADTFTYDAYAPTSGYFALPVPNPSLDQTLPALRAGDLVSFTVPDGGRHVFEFDPTPLTQAEVYQGSNTGVLYKPRFVALDGSGTSLTVPGFHSDEYPYSDEYPFTDALAYDPADDEYLAVAPFYGPGTNDLPDFPLPFAGRDMSNVGFNPAKPSFGNQYQLTNADGTSYLINATTGQIESTSDQNGNTTTYTITSDAVTATGPNGQTLLTAHLNGGNAVTSVDVPSQASVQYGYDAAGNLASVTNQAGSTTAYAYQFPGNAHYLTGVTNGAGATVLQVRYDPTNDQLTAIFDANGVAVPVSNQMLGTGEVVQTVVDQAGNVSQDVYGERYGTLDRVIHDVTDAAGNTDYVVTVTGFSYATDDSGDMSDLYPSGVQVLQAVRTYQAFEVSGADAAGRSLSQEPDADAWVKQVVYNTSDNPDDPASGQLESSSERLTVGGDIQTTLFGDYAVVNATTGAAKPRVTTVELRTPDGASVTGYDDRVRSTTYGGYDDKGNPTYSVTVAARDVNGYPAATPMLAGGFPTTLYLTLADLAGVDGTQAIAWDPATGSYAWSYAQDGHNISIRLKDDGLAGRGAGATPVLGDAWTLAVSNAQGLGGHGLTGTASGLAFDGTPLGLARCVAALLAGDRFTDATTGDLSNGSNDGISLTVPGWLATGTRTDYDGNGFANGTDAVTARVDPDGTVHIIQSTTTARTVNYDANDYVVNADQTAYVPRPGAAYGAPRYTVDAAGQETYYAYDPSGRTVLQYTYKTWTDDAGSAVSGWVGTTNVYDSAGRPADTYQATYRDLSQDAGQGSDHTLPVIAGGPAGIQVDTSVTPVYRAPLRTQHADYNALGQKAGTVDAYNGTTTYTYDANGNVIRTVNPDGTETRTAYDALNRAIWSTNSFDPANLSTAITTRTVYNQLGQVVETQAYAGQLVAVGTKTLGSSVTATTSVATVDGTADGLPSTGTLISTMRTSYDPQGDAIETVGANGLRTGSIYTPDGKVLYTGPLTGGAPDGGHAVTVDGGVTTQAYTTADLAYYGEADPVQFDDALGLFYTRSVDANGNATRSYTDSQGRTVRTVYADGSFAETVYSVGTTPVSADAEGDGVPTPDGWSGITGGGYEVVSVAQRKSTDPPVYTYDLYDAAGRLSDVWLAAVADAGPNATTGTTPANPHWTYTYNTAGNELTQVSGNGNAANANPAEFTTSWAYDQNGNKVRQSLPDGELQTWAYDVYGNNTSHKVYSATDHTTALRTTLGTHDASAAHGGRLLVENRYSSDQPAGSTVTPDERTTYTYDDSTTLPAAEQTDQGNVAEVDDCALTGGSLQKVDFTHYTYDAIGGNQATITTADGTIHYAYDEATGNLVETWTGANPSASKSAAQNDALYGYDAQGRLASVTQVVLNGSTPPSVNGTRYDADGHAVATTEPTTLYTYDNAGNLLTDADPNGDTTAYTYNGLNQVTDEAITNAAGKLLFGQHTDWLDDGQKKDVVDTRGDGSGNVTSQTTTAWAYDADNRLTGEMLNVQSGSGSNVPTPYGDTFAYDLDNNRVKETEAPSLGQTPTETIGYTYNGDDQLKTEAGSGTSNYTTQSGYDADGNLTSEARTGAAPVISTYTYDLQNRMTSATVAGQTATYTYDASGVLASETTAGATAYDLNDPANPTGYTKSIQQSSTLAGPPTTSYVLGLRVESQVDAGNGTRYLLVDGHDSTRALVDSNGTVVPGQTFDFDAFGTTLTNADAAQTNWLLGDGKYDPASGFTDQMSRWRNGATFTTSDTRPHQPGDTDNANGYLYVDSNPTNAWDPTGMALIGSLTDLSSFANTNSGSALSDDAFALAAEIQTEEVTSAQSLWQSAAASTHQAIASEQFETNFTSFVAENIALNPETAVLGFIGARACFPAGAMVLTQHVPGADDVYKRIEELSEGDYVVSRNEMNPASPLVSRRVLRTAAQRADCIRSIAFRDDGGTSRVIDTTDEHPFWVRSRGWTPAHCVGVGDYLIGPDGDFYEVLVNDVQSGRHSPAVYSLDIDADHTYFVSAQGGGSSASVWVHNQCIFQSFQDGLGRVKQSIALISKADIGSGQAVTSAAKTAIAGIRTALDDAGHLIAKNLGGPGTADNVIAQLSRINRGAMRVFESQVAARVAQGADAIVHVVPQYAGNSLRPIGLTIEAEFDHGVKLVTYFRN